MRTLSYPGLAALVALVALVATCVASASCAARTVPAPPVMTRAGVRFVLMQAEATSVALAGSFNQWSASSHPMAREKPGAPWTIVVPLAAGEHTFMYVVDGQWVSPPLAEDYVDDGFGAKNGIVVVRQ